MSSINILLLELFGRHPFLISFFGPFLFGEAAFIFLAFFIGMNKLNLLPTLIILGSLADVSNDLFWFYVPKSNFLRKMKFFKKILKKAEKTSKNFKRLEQKNLFYVIMGSKFLIGTRLLTTISISLNKINTRKFIVASILSAFLWSILIIIIGWTTGRGFLWIQEMFKNTRIGISILVFSAVVLILIRKYIFHSSAKKLINFGMEKRR